ncbi:MAG TPA: HAMP domain-containing protein, partial [Anaerolineales bacterium]|nr:HAMP domain-containing protein [Anaerolineales bacterium]
ANNPMCPPEKPTVDTPPEQNGYYPENNSLYLEHVNWLRSVQFTQLKEDPFGDPTKETTRLYTYIKGPDEGEVIAIGSTGYFRETRGGFRFCQRYTPALNEDGTPSTRIYDGLEQRVDSWVPYQDRFGTWITSYAPILDEQGQPIGAIGVDIQASYVDEVAAEILQQGMIAFAVTFAIIFVLVYWLAGFLTRPIIGLAGVAKKIGEGDYEQELSKSGGNYQDEIDTLTDVFKVMVDKVAQREQSLRARVHQLEIMIDKSKLTKQVTEIVESEFFQDLQSKVKDMRNRFTKED